VEWIPLILGHLVELQDGVQREDQPVVGPIGVEHRAVAACDGGERLLVDGGEMVVLGKGVDRQFPVDGGVQHLLAQR
jgi:hypothetical protein